MGDLQPLILLFRILIPSIYLVLAVGSIVEFIKIKSVHYVWTKPLMTAGILLHGTLLVLLSIQSRHIPYDTVYKGLLFISMVISVLYICIEQLLGDIRYGTFLFPVNCVLSAIATVNLYRGFPLPEALHSNYFVIHASLLFLAYACFAFSFVVSLMYLVQHHEIKNHRLGGLFKRLPSLSDMDQSVMRVDALGLGMLIFGIATGFLWMELVLGVPARISFKIGFSALTAAIYLSEHLLRIGKGWNGQRACWISILGFAFVLVTLLVGRHGY